MIINKAFTANMYKEKFGHNPDQDEIQRINCPHAMTKGHMHCGWNYVKDMASFMANEGDEADVPSFLTWVNSLSPSEQKVRKAAQWLLAELLQDFHCEVGKEYVSDITSVEDLTYMLNRAAFDKDITFIKRTDFLYEALDNEIFIKEITDEMHESHLEKCSSMIRA